MQGARFLPLQRTALPRVLQKPLPEAVLDGPRGALLVVKGILIVHNPQLSNNSIDDMVIYNDYEYFH